MKNERLILVNRSDIAIGEGDKMEVHRSGQLHRAFSIFLWNDRGELLLQRRAYSKYHSGGLWANSCCGHPRPGEPTDSATHRRLWEEMGTTARLSFRGIYSYSAKLSNSLVENEIVHIYAGYALRRLRPNASEIQEVRWACPEALLIEIAEHPNHYAAWFKLYLTDISLNTLKPCN